MEDASALQTKQMDSKIENFNSELATHWRNSIPSIVLAVVTLVLAVINYGWVQPRIQSKYKRILSESLTKAGADNLGTSNGSQLPTLATASEEQTKLLERAQLSVRRLSVWNSGDENYWYQSALISDLLSKAYVQAARSLSQNDTDRVRVLMTKSETESQRAADGMRRISKKSGDISNAARLWLISKSLDNSTDLTPKDLDRFDEELSSIETKVADFSAYRILQVQVKVLRALRPTSELDDEARKKLLHSASEVANAISETELVNACWTAMAKSIVTPTQGKEIAWKASQDFWLLPQDRPQTSALISSIFDCLVISGSIKEAQSLLVRVLDKTPMAEQMPLRHRVADVCLRSIVASHFRSESQDTNRNATLLAMAIQLAPDSVELQKFFDVVSTSTQDDFWYSKTNRELRSGTEEPLWRLLELSSLTENADRKQLEAIAKSISTMGAYAIAGSRIALKRSTETPGLVRKLIELLEIINQINPDLYVIWSDRATLHVQLYQYEQALKCFEFLSSKMPDNKEIKNSLEQLKSRIQ